jgi:hypothetical protein
MAFDFEFNDYHITAEVDECRDGYGTGDSPTLYDVEILSVTNDDGVDIDINDLGRFFYDQLVDEAISIYKE